MLDLKMELAPLKADHSSLILWLISSSLGGNVETRSPS